MIKTLIIATTTIVTCASIWYFWKQPKTQYVVPDVIPAKKKNCVTEHHESKKLPEAERNRGLISLVAYGPPDHYYTRWVLR